MKAWPLVCSHEFVSSNNALVFEVFVHFASVHAHLHASILVVPMLAQSSMNCTVLGKTNAFSIATAC